MLLDSVPARVALPDRERRRWVRQPDYARFVGRPVEEILGRTVQQLVDEAPYSELRPLGARALAGELVRWEGWMSHLYVPYRTVGGSIDGYFILTRNLTELKRTEQRLADQLKALHASQALAEAITIAALDCVVVIDETGTVVSFNPAAEPTFSFQAVDAVGWSIADLIVPPDQVRYTQRECSDIGRPVTQNGWVAASRRHTAEAWFSHHQCASHGLCCACPWPMRRTLQLIRPSSRWDTTTKH